MSDQYTLSAGFKFRNTPLTLSASFGSDFPAIFTAEIGDLTMPDIAAYLIDLFHPGGTFQAFPPPWDFLNDINFKGLTLTLQAKSKTGVGENMVGISYPFSIDLEFVKITGLQIAYYTDLKKVAITPQGLLLGKPIPQWPIYPQNEAPKVPGFGDSYFKLKFLGVGQHISVMDMQKADTVAQAIATLEDNFAEDKKVVPRQGAKPGDLIFSPETGWMIGTRFIVIDTVDLSVIYNDPYLYGLALSLSGAKAKSFAGLYIELLYRKVTDTIGVYSLELKLPDAMRQIELGAVSFTLPIINISIYSNGNFRVDLGFPDNNDWTRVATVQFFPFIGAGGFYFAYLTGATASRLPSDYDPAMGSFNPVIDFGIALRLGIGKTIDKGILAAGVSLTFQGIVTGTYAFFSPNAGTNRSSDSYYYLNGQFQVVGHVYGEINFAIIMARLDVMLYAGIGVVIEAYRDIVLYIDAGVSLSLTISINLGLFSIDIDLSFSTSISFTFTLPPPDGSHAQWAAIGNLQRDPNPYHISLVAPKPQPLYTTRLTCGKRFEDADKPTLVISFLPQFSARTTTGSAQAATFITCLFLDTGAAGAKDAGNFGTLARAFLRWLATTYHSEIRRAGVPKQLQDTAITIKELNDLYAVVSQDTGGVPVIAYADLKNFLYNSFDIQINPVQQKGEKSLSATPTSFSGTVFPVIPSLSMQANLDAEAPFVTVDFSKPLVSSDYNETIQEYFAKLDVHYRTPLEAANNTTPTPPPAAVEQSLATFIFEDYFLLLARSLVQACIDLMRALPYATGEQDSIAALVQGYGIGAAALINANPDAPLVAGQPVQLGNTVYVTQTGDSFSGICIKFNLSASADQQLFLTSLVLNQGNCQLVDIFLPGKTLTLSTPKATELSYYTTKSGDTLNSISTATGFTPFEIVWNNASEKNILSLFVSLTIPAYTIPIPGDMTFAKMAAFGNISSDQFASNNATSTAPLFALKTPLTLPEVKQVTSIEVLIDGITANSAVRNLSGMASRYLLHGMRAPAPPEFHLELNGDTKALYDLTAQQFDFPAGITGAASCTITLNDGSGVDKWFNIVSNAQDNAATAAKLTLDATDLAQVATLSTTLFMPETVGVYKGTNFTAEPNRYMLKTPALWNASSPVFVQGPTGYVWPGGPSGPSGGWWPYSPTGSSGLSGPTGWILASAPKIWYFSDELSKAISEQKQLLPLFEVYIGKNNTVEQKFDKTKASVYGWSTVIPISIQQVASSLSPGTEMATLFEIESTSNDGLKLLERLLSNQFDPLLPEYERVDIGQVHILYAPLDAGSKAGMMSVDPSQVIAAVVQSNLSTLRNPEMTAALSAGSVGKIFGSFNQDPVNNIKRLWEACSVKSGGFYLYYFNSNSGQGIPSSVFNNKGQGEISLVITYGLPQQYGYPFLNSLTFGEEVPQDAYLFAEPQAQAATGLANTTTVQDILAGYRVTLEQLSLKLGGFPLNAGDILVKDIIFLLTTSDWTLSKLASQFNVNQADILALNPGIDFSALKQGDALRIPTVTYNAKAGEILDDIASKYTVSTLSLLWANRNKSLFQDLSSLVLEDRSIKKTPSIVPGAVSFELLRDNPQWTTRYGAWNRQVTGSTGAPALNPQQALNLNYNLLTYALKDNPGFHGSVFAMPASPGNTGSTGTTGSTGSAMLSYSGVLPAFSYAKATPTAAAPSIPSPQSNPYLGTGDILQVNMDWQDLYGNRTITPFNDPSSYPGCTYLNNFPQKVGYTDPLLTVLQWPSVGFDHLFEIDPQLGNVLGINGAFDTSTYQPSANPSDQGLIKQVHNKAQTDRETFRSAIYQLSASNVSAVLTTSIDNSPTGRNDITLPLLGMLDGVFHYLDALSCVNYSYFVVKSDSVAAAAATYRMSPEYIAAQNVNSKPAPGPITNEFTFFLPNDNFYLYTPLENETLTAIADKMQLPVSELKMINPGVPETPGVGAIVVVPNYRFGSYTTLKTESIADIAMTTAVSAAVIIAANPGVTDPVPPNKELLIPYFNCSLYTIKQGDSLSGLAATFNIPEPVLNAATSRYTWPIAKDTIIPIPTGDFMQYKTVTGDSLTSLASSRWTAYDLLKRLNPAVPENPTAGTALLIPKTPIPYEQKFPVSFDQTLAPITLLDVSITISRPADQIDESFLDQPGVCVAPGRISPRLKDSAAKSTKDEEKGIATLLYYATQFEETFSTSNAKIAALGNTDNTASQIYVIRLYEGVQQVDANTIRYQISAGGPAGATGAAFYAPIPLATYPLGASFYIPQYISGQGFTGSGQIGASGPGALLTSFRGMELDNIAENIFSAVDEMLQPDLSRALLQLDQYLGTSYRQRLLDAKQDIATAYSQLVQPVVENMTGAQQDAGQALEQQMLQQLSNLNTIGTIVQLKVKLNSPCDDSVLLFGNPVTAGASKNGPDNQVTFTPARIGLSDQSGTWMTFIATTSNPAAQKNFEVDLGFKPLALEFNIHKVPGIKDYQSSEWLFFVKPLAEVEIGSISVPVPLREFPVPPTPLSQTAKSPNDPDSQTLSLQQTRQWQYSFDFQRSEASQDLTYVNILFNVEKDGITMDAVVPDLFMGLAVWNVNGGTMMSDMRNYLPQLGPGIAPLTFNLCSLLVNDYLSVVEYVASAIPFWLQLRDQKYGPTQIKRKMRANGLTADAEYLIINPAEAAPGDFYIQLNQQAPTVDLGMPYALLPANPTYEPTIIAPHGEKPGNIFQTYYFVDSKTGKYIPDPVKTDNLSITFGQFTNTQDKSSFGKWLDIMQQWNAWGGAYITRNQYLFDGTDGKPDMSLPTNSNFVYSTATVRSYNASVPMLDFSVPLDINEMPTPLPVSGIRTLSQQLAAMLFNYFGADPTYARNVRIKLVWTYYYCINMNHAADTPAQFVNVPGGLIPPFIFEMPGDWQCNCDAQPESFACRLASVIEQWITDNKVPGAEADAYLQFDVTAFSNLSDNKLPFYRLRNLFVRMDDIFIQAQSKP